MLGRHGAAVDEGRQRAAIKMREQQLAGGVVAVGGPQVTPVQVARAKPLDAQRTAVQRVADGDEEQGERRAALLPVDDAQPPKAPPALCLLRAEHHTGKMLPLLFAGPHDIAPQDLALPLCPRVDALVYRDDKLGVGNLQELEQRLFSDVHLFLPYHLTLMPKYCA